MHTLPAKGDNEFSYMTHKANTHLKHTQHYKATRLRSSVLSRHITEAIATVNHRALATPATTTTKNRNMTIIIIMFEYV